MPVVKGDEIVHAYVLKNIAYELQFYYAVAENMYENEQLYKEYIGKISHFFIKYQALAEYILKDNLLSFFKQIDQQVDSLLLSEFAHLAETDAHAIKENQILSASISYASQLTNASAPTSFNDTIPEFKPEPINIELEQNAVHIDISGARYHFKTEFEIQTIQINAEGAFEIRGLNSEQKIDFSNFPIQFNDLTVEQLYSGGTRIMFTPYVNADTETNASVITKDQLRHEVIINLPDVNELHPCQLVGDEIFNQSNVACNYSWQSWMLWATGLAYNPYVFIPITIAIALYQDKIKEHANDINKWIYQKSGIDLSLPENSGIRLAFVMSSRALLGGPVNLAYDITTIFKYSFNKQTLTARPGFYSYMRASFWGIKDVGSALMKAKAGNAFINLWNWLGQERHSYWWVGIAGASVWDLINVFVNNDRNLLANLETAVETIAKNIPGYNTLNYHHSENIAAKPQIYITDELQVLVEKENSSRLRFG